MADTRWPPPGPWQPIPGIVRLIEKSPKAKAENRDCTDQLRDDNGEFAGCGDSGGSDSSSSGGSGDGASSGGGAITADEARGDSRPVSAEEFASLSAEGQGTLQGMADNASAPTGLDQNWGAIKADAYGQVQQSWGGATYDAHTGQAFTTNDNVYALSVKPPGVETVALPEGASAAQFGAAMDTARQTFADQLSYQGGALGVFHDDQMGEIQIDPVITVDSLHSVETIGAYTHAVGGAYNFADGNGYWPPHVSDGALVGSRYQLPAHRYLQRKKQSDGSRMWIFDYDGTVTGAPDQIVRIANGLRALGDKLIILTGNVSPRAELVKSLADFGMPYDDLVQYHDDGTNGGGREHYLKQLGAWGAFDNRIDRAPILVEVCPHLFVIAAPSDQADTGTKADKKATKKAAKKAAKALGVRARRRPEEFRGIAAPPPGLRISTDEDVDDDGCSQECGTCLMFTPGADLCWGYGRGLDQFPTFGEWVCDSWARDPGWQQQDVIQDALDGAID